MSEVLQVDPTLSTAHWGIGLTYEQKGMEKEAIAALLKATSVSKSLNLQASLGHAGTCNSASASKQDRFSKR